MFKKILIANRGEIACRIIRTARRMGIATVAVYSEADAEALHVREADEAVLIGPPPSAESYLRSDRLVDAFKKNGAEAGPSRLWILFGPAGVRPAPPRGRLPVFWAAARSIR